MVATQTGEPLTLEYTELQDKIFCQSTARYVIGACGRRSGKTYGAAEWCIDSCLQGSDKALKIIWVDLQYNQISGYIKAYFLPILRQLHKSLWHYDISHREITIAGSTITFRSVDRPDLLVGRGYNMMIVNEAGISLYNDQTVWFQILLPMLMDYEDSRAWLIGTPRGLIDKAGKDNLFYLMFEHGQKHEDGYESYRYDTYSNPYLSADRIREIEAEIPPLLRAQELNAEFLNVSDMCIFEPAWWSIVTEEPTKPSVIRKFISIDTAFSEKETADESAATVWEQTALNHYYCIDCWHDRLDYPALVTAVKKLITKHSPDNIVVENKASGQSLIQTLKQDLPGFVVTKWPPDGLKLGDKVTRATAITTLFEQGRVHLLKASWNKDMINQCTVFPNGSNDDICFVAGTLIATPAGDRPIESLSTGSLVLTPLGSRKIVNYCVHNTDRIITKFGLTATPNHPVFSNKCTFTKIDTISQAELDILSVWTIIKWCLRTASYLKESPTENLVGKEFITTIASITLPLQKKNAIELLKPCTGLSGRNITRMKKFLQVMKFITTTLILIITNLTIYGCYRCHNIGRLIGVSLVRMFRSNILLKYVPLQLPGINLLKVVHGIPRMLQVLGIRIKNAFALNAGISSWPLIATPNSVATIAMKRIDIRMIPVQNPGYVSNVVSPLPQNSGENELLRPVQGPVDAVKVYNIEVEQAHCYYANRILVGNCDTISQALNYARPHSNLPNGGFVTRKIVPKITRGYSADTNFEEHYNVQTQQTSSQSVSLPAGTARTQLF